LRSASAARLADAEVEVRCGSGTERDQVGPGERLREPVLFRHVLASDDRSPDDAWPRLQELARTDDRIRAIRLFQDKSGWTPHYTESGVDAGFQLIG